MARRRRQGFGSQPCPAPQTPPPGSQRQRPHPASVQEQQALTLLRQGERGQAEQLLRQLIEAGQASASAYCNLAAILGMSGRAGEMVDLLERALKLKPDYPEALSNLGIAYQETGQKDKALNAYRQALRLRPDYPEALCNLGSALQDGGDLDGAIEAYGQALKSRPDDPDAFTNLGMALRLRGDLPRAIDALRQALVLRPNHLEALIGLGQALRDSGEIELALHTWRQALALAPQHPELHSHLASLLRRQGHLVEACEHFERALKLRPDFPEALVNLGDIHKEQGRLPEAIHCFEQAISLRPAFPEALSNLGIVHQMLDDSAAAIAAYRQAIALEPGFAAAHSNLGISLSEQGDFAAAVDAFREAIRLEPDFAEAHSNLGIALEETGQLEASIAAYRQALALQPDYPEAYCNLGNALQEQGLIEASLASYRRAVELRPHYPDAWKNLSMVLLLSGDYRQGWQAYEWRFQSPKGPTILNALPAGDACHDSLPAAGEPLLLVSEQGYGDTLQFMRYVHPLRERGLAVRLCAPSKLHGLIQASGIDPAPLAPEQVHGQSLGPWLPLLSLPRHLGVSASEPVVRDPYLRTTEALHRRWQERLAPERRPIIAINWQGNPEHETSTSKGRSLPLEAFAPLARLEGISLLSLQKGHGSEQLDTCSFRDRFVHCQDLVSDTWDFLETAAMIANCDLVITSDTSVAHLAAGLGQTTWLLLKHVAEWRWGLEGESSGWYPSMRLFRQRRPGDWDALLQRVTETLAEALAQGCLNGRLPPPEPLPANAWSHRAAELERAQRLLAQGRHDEAERLCRALLSSDDEDPAALQLLAGLCEATGRQEEQLHLLRRAATVEPQSAPARYNLAVLLQQRGENAAAIEAYRQALALDPDLPEALGNLGVALQAAGDGEEAIRLLCRAVELRPDFADAYSNLGNAYQAQARFDAAIAAYSRALELRPTYAECLSNLATALKERKDHAAAEAACRQALALRPDYPEALSNLGNILQAQGDPEAAIGCYRQAIHLKPDYANAHYNLGIALKDLNQLEAAIAAYQAAIAIQPHYPNAHSNLGNAWQELGELDKAITAYETALRYNEQHPGANKNLSMALLLKGDYVRGWPRYEWRFEDEPGLDLLFARPELPRWDGSALPAGTALTLVGEQGLGDVLQFMRYALPLRQQGLAVSLCAVRKLHGLIQASGIDAAPLTPSQAQQRRDGLWIPLLSLPQHLGVSRENPVVSAPYIHTTPARLEHWRQILAAEAGPIIGLNWQGNPDHEKTNSRGRSLPLEAFAPLAQLDGVSFLSLQKGHGSEQLDTCSFRERFVDCQALVSEAWDFEETAAIISHCDLVISSDTSVVHLAGGLGVPTWVLLKDVPEWRWGLEGDTTFWYPSLRLFRQKQRGDWDEVMQRVLLALRQHLESSAPQTHSRSGPQHQAGSGEAGAAPAPPNAPVAAADGSSPATASPATASPTTASPAKVAQATAAPPTAGPGAGGGAETPAVAAGLQAQDPDAIASLGLSLQEQGDVDGAIAAYRRALQLRPTFIAALSNLGLLLHQRGEPDAAIDCFEKALLLQPGEEAATIHYNLGNAQQQRGELERATSAYEAALQLRQNHPGTHNNHGVVLQEQGDLEAAIRSFRRSLQQDPGYLEARLNLAMALLLSGDYGQGWPLYNSRFSDGQLRSLLCARPGGPVWDGTTPAAGSRLLLVAEQGLGDTLQFMRYAPALRQQGIAVTLCADPKLHGLMQHSGIDPQPLDPEQAEADVITTWLPLLSLPQILNVTASDPLVSAPYIHTSQDHLARWRSILSQDDGPRIALNWQGNPDHEKSNSRGRSLPLETFAPLAQLDGVRFLSLQKGHGSEQLDTCSFRDRFVRCQQQVSDAWDFLDTAAIVAHCDLVITSDTAVAHLAAGMGRPTWLLLKQVPEWRWGLRGTTTGWYPSMRLFRQSRRGDWDEVMQRVLLALRQHLESSAPPTHSRSGPQHQAGSGVAEVAAPPTGPTDLETRLQQAEVLFAAGRWQEAETAYRDLGSAGSSEAHRLNRLGQICGLTGRFRDMADWLEQALRLRPDDPGALGNLGLAYQELGDQQAALEAYGRSLRLRPDAPDVLTNQGTIWQSRGDLAAAIGCYRQALALQPEHADAHCNLGLALQERGDHHGALAAYGEAIRCNPDHARAHYNLGCLHHADGHPDAAIAAYLEVIRIEPEFPGVQTSLGNSYKRLGDLEAAIAAYEQGLALHPDDVDTLCNLGNSHLVRAEPAQAIRCFERALAVHPGHARTLHNYGIALQEQGEVQAAIEAFQRSCRHDPHFAEPRGALAMALLLSGDYRQGWQTYEWRFQSEHGPQLLIAHPPLPRWDGRPLLPGERLILVSEQGLGDTLQFMRYALHLRRQGVQVSLCAPRKLHGLIQASGVDPEPLSPEEAQELRQGSWLPLLSLPALLEVSPERPLLNAPYLRTSDARIASWRTLLAAEQRPIVAINWQGNPDHEHTTSMGRSLPLEAFAPLAATGSVRLLSLQKGHGSEQMATCAFRERFVDCQQRIDATWDFLETAAIIANCDLVISSDTAVAHLAAGMGKPTWLLLKHVPEWRWGLKGERSFWYPSMRLFRQSRRGDWEGVLSRVASMLSQQHFT